MQNINSGILKYTVQGCTSSSAIAVLEKDVGWPYHFSQSW